MSNDQRVGELSKLYLQIGTVYDTTQDDVFILGDDSWKEFCVVQFTRTSSNSLRAVKDRCAGVKSKFSYAKTEDGVGFSINQSRWKPDDKKAFDAVIRSKKVVGVLALTDVRTDAKTYGVVGNFVLESINEEHPEEGNNTETFALKEGISPFNLKPVYGVLAPFNTSGAWA